MLQVRENEISLRNSSGVPEYLRTLEEKLIARILASHECWTSEQKIEKTLQNFHL